MMESLFADRRTDGRTLTWLVGHKNRTYFFFIALKKRYIKEAKKTQRKRQKLNIKLFVQLNCNYKYFGVLRYLVRIFFLPQLGQQKNSSFADTLHTINICHGVACFISK